MLYDDEPVNFEEVARLQNLDEQIDQRLRERAHAPDRQEPLDPQLLRDLQGFHQPRAQAFQRGLDRVWTRLEQRGVAPAQHPRQNGPINRPGSQQERLRSMQRIFHTGQRWSARITTLVAVALLAVLIGGLTLGLILVHRAGSSTGGNPTKQPTGTAATTPTPVTTPGSGQAIGLSAIHMIDAMTGWAQGPLAAPLHIFRTTDGGARWQDVTPSSVSAASGVLSTYYLNGSVAWLVLPAQPGANTSVVLRTTNGGQTWQQEGSPQTNLVIQITFIDTQHGWIMSTPFGGAAGSVPVDVFRTTDGGASWVQVQSARNSQNNPPGAIPSSGDKTGLSFLNASTGWLTGFSPAGALFYVTHDGGLTWQQQTLSAPAGVTQEQYEVLPPTFFNDHDGVLPVQVDTPTAGAADTDVYVTHDSGATWQSTALVQASDRSVAFIDANHGWATDGTILFATSNGGQHWTRLPASRDFHDVATLDFVSNMTGWAISEPASGASTLLKTTDGGQTWMIVTPTL